MTVIVVGLPGNVIRISVAVPTMGVMVNRGDDSLWSPKHRASGYLIKSEANAVSHYQLLLGFDRIFVNKNL